MPSNSSHEEVQGAGRLTSAPCEKNIGLQDKEVREAKEEVVEQLLELPQTLLAKKDVQEEVKHYMAEDMDKLLFKPYRKVALLQARLLTQEDFEERGGAVKTLEGSVKFQPGDYLARILVDEEWKEWPIESDYFQVTYTQVEGPNQEGFSIYSPPVIERQAVQIDHPFTVDLASNGNLVEGKAGDYLIRMGERAWIVGQKIFKEIYQLISTKN
jgi:hypothetical protein